MVKVFIVGTLVGLGVTFVVLKIADIFINIGREKERRGVKKHGKK